jgi:hypothetical protein
MRAFSLYRWLKEEPFLASVRPRGFVNCARCRRQLAASGSRFERSPVHLEGTQLLPTIEPFEGVRQHGPAAERQKAITPVPPKVLHLPITNTERDKDLALTQSHRARSFLFAMRSCEYTKSVPLGRTKRVRMGCFVFRTASDASSGTQIQISCTKQSMSQSYSKIRRKKMDARTQRRSGHKFLCRIALGICHSADHRDHPSWNEQTTLCSVTLEETLEKW